MKCLLLLIVLALCGCAGPQSTDQHGATVPEAMTALVKRHHVCAAAVAVIKHRRLEAIHFASGCEPAPAVRANSVFQAASLSKPVFAYAVLKLVAQGRMDLDASVMNYLPQGYRHRANPLQPAPADLVTDPQLSAVTVRMALNHTSGLPNWSGGRLRVGARPGSAFSYSGEGYVMLQRAVEAVTGQPLDVFMAAQVFKPLAMQHSSYVWTEQRAQGLLPGTKANGAARATMVMKEPVAAFSLYTSAADYARFMTALLNDDRAIANIAGSPVAVDAQLGLFWGLGWGMEGGASDATIWQWGNNPGYRAFAMASLDTGDGFVMLTNSENGLALAEPLAHTILLRDYKLFRSPILGTDVFNMLCNGIRICL